jgi:hypothetical protein
MDRWDFNWPKRWRFQDQGKLCSLIHRGAAGVTGDADHSATAIMPTHQQDQCHGAWRALDRMAERVILCQASIGPERMT